MKKFEKLENPSRLAELNPRETLKMIGVKNDSVICDIGTGSGIFAIAAAELSKAFVYAIDINHELLEITMTKAKERGLNNLKGILASSFKYPIKDKEIDFVLMVTVFHEIDQKEVLLKEIQRILKDSGYLCMIEFKKSITPFGPPVNHRISYEEVIQSTRSMFKEVQKSSLGPNFDLLLFSKK